MVHNTQVAKMCSDHDGDKMDGIRNQKDYKRKRPANYDSVGDMAEWDLNAYDHVRKSDHEGLWAYVQWEGADCVNN